MSAMEAAEVPVTIPQIGLKERVAVQPRKIDNEYQNARKATLRPLTSVSVEIKDEKQSQTVNFNEGLNDEFAYYCRTREVETGTERTNILQGIANKMTEGMGVGTRVVIMNKGEEAEAFVMPEGTIFISQSCINKLGTLDEIGGVLAHEVRHIVQKTYQKSLEAKGYFTEFTVGWLHEMSSDLMTAQLLEKAGLSSMGFSSAIEKISGTNRGIIHQSGLMRASQATAGHFAIDYKTSSQEETMLPEILKKSVKPTNYEMVKKAIETNNVRGLKELLPNLHPDDLKKTVYSVQKILKDQERDEPLSFLVRKPEPKQMVVSCYDLISSRLKSAGYNSEEVSLFLLSLPLENSFYRWDQLGGGMLPIIREKIVPTPERLLELVKASVDFDKSKKYQGMNELIFNKKEINSLGTILPIYLYELIEFTETPNAAGIPVTRDVLLECLKELKSYDNTEILYIYFEKVFLSRAKEGEIDEAQIKELFEQAEKMGIELDVNKWEEKVRKEPSENNKTALKILWEVKGWKKEEEKEIDFEKTIQEAFCLEESYSTIDKIKLLPEKFTNYQRLFLELRSYFIKNKFEGEEMQKRLSRICELINGLELGKTYDWMHFLSTGDYKDFKTDSSTSQEKIDLNEKVAKLNLKMMIGIGFFKEDNPDFYIYMNKVMNESGLGQALPKEELGIILRKFLKIIDNYHMLSRDICLLKESGGTDYILSDCIEIRNFDQFGELSLLNDYQAKEEKAEVSDFTSLLEYAKKTVGGEHIDIFSDELRSVIMGRGIREKFLFLLKNQIPSDQYPAFLDFVKIYYPKGPLKDEVIKELHERYLVSKDVSLEKKIGYQEDNFESIGPEGMVIIAEGIFTLAEYQEFRQRMGKRLEQFLDGSNETIKQVAIGDVLSYFFARKYFHLLDSCSNSYEVSRRQSTDLAKEWFGYFMLCNSHGEPRFACLENGKIAIDSQDRDKFRAFSDIIESLQNQGYGLRLGTLMKALVEDGGAFSSKKDRKKLGRIITSSLGHANGFVGIALRSACEVANPKYISFPIANMLAPLLFRSFNPENVDFGRLSREKVYYSRGDMDTIKYYTKKIGTIFTAEAIRRLIQSTTQELVYYGYRYKEHSESVVSGLAQESYRQANQVAEILEKFVSQREVKKEGEVTGLEINPSTEAVIKGVEATGTIGVRSLQLARQLYQFSPELDRRLSFTLDANKGLNKLLFWENLAKLAEQDSAIGDFVQNRLVRVDGYLGGGSLFTTYSAVAKGEQGEEKHVVLKMLNPNAQAFIDNVYKIAKDSLDLVAKRTIGESKRQAKIGQVLIGLSREWCTKDINDQHFIEDDQVFRRTIAAFNKSEGTEAVYVPELEFNSVKLKAEDRAEGITANKLLENGEFDSNVKQRVCEQIGRLFAFQLANPTERGDYLIHADPHVGNYIVEVINGQPRIGIIDRSMYLRLKEEDVRVIRALVGGDNQEFLDSLINRVLDVNGVNGVSRGRILVSTKLAAASEFARQVGKKPDKFAILNSVLSKLVDAKMEVPLEMRLMIKNIGSIKELLERNGVSFDRVFMI